MKRLTILLFAALIAFSPVCTAERTRTRWAHAYRNGSRDEPRVAVTVDDWMYPDQWLPKFMAVAEQYHVKMTLYPNGINLKPQDRELWQAALDAGHEIGSHFYTHKRLTERSEAQVKKDLERFQKALDETLGYHYEFLTVRPPYGAGLAQGGSSKVGNWIHRCGFDHIVLWDMDNIVDMKYALRRIKNGSIILLHADEDALAFFGRLMEALQERNYEYVTVSELLHITERWIYVD